MIKKLSIVLLEFFEALFLYAHGWRRGIGAWEPPPGYPFRRLLYTSRRHAVNAQRQTIYNPMHGGTRREPEATAGTPLHIETRKLSVTPIEIPPHIDRNFQRHHRHVAIAITLWMLVLGIAFGVVVLTSGWWTS